MGINDIEYESEQENLATNSLRNLDLTTEKPALRVTKRNTCKKAPDWSCDVEYLQRPSQAPETSTKM